jgi:hypothetical protein
MMASRATGFFVLLRVSIILLSFRSNEVMAWQSSSRAKTTIIGTTHGRHNPSDGPEILPSPRRELLSLIPKMAATVAAATVMLPHRACAAAPPGMTADSARDQWRNAFTALDDLLQNWSTEKWAEEVGGGDAIRTKLGKQGATSCSRSKGVRTARFNSRCYRKKLQKIYGCYTRPIRLAPNNKTGSGTQTPPAILIERYRAEVVKMQSIAKKMNAMVK